MQKLYNVAAYIGSRLVRHSSDMSQPSFLSQKIQQGEIQKILIVALQQLGDNLVFTPTLRAIVEQLGHLQIDMLVNSVGYEVYKNVPQIRRFYVDHTWYWGKGERRLLPLLKLLAKIRKEQYDLAILDATCVALKYPTITYLTGARYRLGIDQHQRGFLNNIRISYQHHLNLVERNLALLSFLGLTRPSSKLWLVTSEQDRLSAAQLMQSIKSSSSDKVIVIHQGSNWSSKQWFSERWVALSQRLLTLPETKLVFTGAERERAQVDAIVLQLKRSDRVFSLVGKTSIHILKEFIALADLFLTVDTGPMHIGNCTDTPMVVLASAIDYENFWIQPSERVIVLRKEVSCKYCRAEVCPLGTKECMRLIEVDEVFEAARYHLTKLRNANASLSDF
ncbi:MAG: glycosyltransferase family 9 protein [Chloroherpetonaceae bacterium]|nr:glycosyltransferase family 9 protein [Chloroherpetonaceae bacterium]MCS7212343.1 glycosyltransferase family 9 protein [Chloroherpetonaceae bacterium]